MQNILRRRRVISNGDNLEIPAGYTRVQYLQKTTAKPYVVLMDDAVQKTCAFRVIFSVDDIQAQARICGNFRSTPSNTAQLYINGAGGFGFAGPGSNNWRGISSLGSIVEGRKYDITLDYPNRLVISDGKQEGMGDGTLATQIFSVYLPSYGSNTTGSTTSNTFIGKIFRFWCWTSGRLIRNIVPVRQGSTGLFYDAANEKLYSPKAGSFIVGPDY